MIFDRGSATCPAGGTFQPHGNCDMSSLGAKDAQGNVIVLGPRSDVAIGEPIF
jgi:hypothetical protein